jgi:hypothetical protein
LTPINWKRWELFQRTIEACLLEGYSRVGVVGVGKGSALEEAEGRLVGSGQLVISPKTRGYLSKWVGIQEKRAKRGQDHRCPNWALSRTVAAARIAPASRVVERYILTSAQNDTPVHNPFLTNLKGLAAYYGARLHVGRFTYQTSLAADRVRSGSKTTKQVREHTWAPELNGILTSERIGLGNLLFCAEMNTLPTAARPLSGLHTYGQGRTAIFPHAKVALETVPVGGDCLPPCVLTTGACTIPSYTDTKAGHKGIFHHILGAVVVETDTSGRTFFRHVIGRSDGSFQDLDLFVDNGNVTAGHRVEAITHGDLQLPYLDPGVARATWGIDAETLNQIECDDVMVDALRPRFAFFHDSLDCKPISHHDEHKPRERFRLFVQGKHRISDHVAHGAKFFRVIAKDWQKSIIIESNHDRWIERWLDRCDHRKDRDNALAFLHWERARMEAERIGDSDFNVFRFALTDASNGHLPAEVVPEGGSYVICQSSGGIECGAHGHLGPNGGPSSPNALARVSGKCNVGDKHSPGIYDGLYVAGTSSLLRLGFNKGPSSWRHANIVTYETGKRALVFIEDGRWRA